MIGLAVRFRKVVEIAAEVGMRDQWQNVLRHGAEAVGWNDVTGKRSCELRPAPWWRGQRSVSSAGTVPVCREITLFESVGGKADEASVRRRLIAQTGVVEVEKGLVVYRCRVSESRTGPPKDPPYSL